MAKLTKLQRRQIENALASVDRAISFIEQERIAICSVREENIRTAQGLNEYRAPVSHRSQRYEGRDNSVWSIDYVKTLSPIDKGIGSDLVSIYTAKRTLEDILVS